MDIYEIWDTVYSGDWDKFLEKLNEKDGGSYSSITKSLITSLIYNYIENNCGTEPVELIQDIASEFNHDYCNGNAFVMLYHPTRVTYSGILPENYTLKYRGDDYEGDERTRKIEELLERVQKIADSLEDK